MIAKIRKIVIGGYIAHLKVLSSDLETRSFAADVEAASARW
jgi:hypothetical protein